ncbi:hypothetical protein N7478_013151 [Penicillium angulare]|uniref:uncharacterized protein n=1 Tax=Penicillium angulare TaxID=116970 RepID=UPI002541185B|nr:uncharacterized protein N7478_013151 [Penicillium angulare]KAJ5257047.1 hypothetical protein N7478_013151 [Penicillium angulare]
MEAETLLTIENLPSMTEEESERPKKKRVRHWTEEDRASHREFEKSRREAFSERLMVGDRPPTKTDALIVTNEIQELTRLLPKLKEETRPSKHIIVDESISHHKAQQARCDQAVTAIQALMAERDELLREVNNLRTLYQPDASVPRQAQPVDPAVLEVMAESTRSNEAHETQNIDDLQSNHLHTKFQPPVLLSRANEGPHIASYSGATIENPPLAQIPLGWTWPGPNNSANDIPQNLSDEGSFVWNDSPDPLTPSWPKVIDIRPNSNASYLVHDSASFWTQHPGPLRPTPPQNTTIHYGVDLAGLSDDMPRLWYSNIGIDTATIAGNEHSISLMPTLSIANSLPLTSKDRSI